MSRGEGRIKGGVESASFLRHVKLDIHSDSDVKGFVG